MRCKNDPKKSYKGDEPSPKGLGYCAHAEEDGSIREGRDGKKWVVKNGRWVRYNDLMDDLLKSKKLLTFWRRLASGQILVIFDDGESKMMKGNNWKKIETTNVKAIIWSGISFDNYTFFVNYVVKKQKKLADMLMNSPEETMVKYYQKLTEKYVINTEKDRTLRFLQ